MILKGKCMDKLPLPFPIRHWHIEPTSKCLLECPLCDRTWFYEKFHKRLNYEINIDDVVNFFEGYPTNVTLCGNYGDPIYHSKFHELCQRLKNIDCVLHITTNGSGKQKSWWTDLCSILSAEDKITFSVDGLADTNHLYRKNAKWETIMEAMNVVTQHKIRTTWKFIVFKQNQHQIEQAKEFSKSLGIQTFLLEHSDRWWKQEMMPDKEYVNQHYQHQIAVTQQKDKGHKITQRCMTVTNGNLDNGLYIDAEGNFYPCCKLAAYAFRYKTIFSPKLKKYNIKNNTMEQIVNDNEIKKFVDSTKSYETADKCCKIYCGVSNG